MMLLFQWIFTRSGYQTDKTSCSETKVSVFIYTTEYTTNHNPLVVYRHLTTGGMWYNVYTTDYTTNHNPLVVYRHLTTDGLCYNILTTNYITIHLLYIDTLQQVHCAIIY
jgi:hypothetical protein